MKKMQIIPIQYAIKEVNECDQSLVLLILSILCTLSSIFTIREDAFMLYFDWQFHLYNDFVFILVFSIIKYSSIIYMWIIYFTYLCEKSLSPCFKKASEIILASFMVVLIPYIILVISWIFKDSYYENLSKIDPIYPYIACHLLFEASLAYFFTFVLSQKQTTIVNEDNEYQPFTRINR